MRGGQRECAARAKAVEYRNAERAAFFGIGGAAQLVEQDERIRRYVVEHAPNMIDVGGERAEAFLNRLVVADIGEHLLEHRKLGVGRGDWQAGLVINAN